MDGAGDVEPAQPAAAAAAQPEAMAHQPAAQPAADGPAAVEMAAETVSAAELEQLRAGPSVANTASSDEDSDDSTGSDLGDMSAAAVGMTPEMLQEERDLLQGVVARRNPGLATELVGGQPWPLGDDGQAPRALELMGERFISHMRRQCSLFQAAEARAAAAMESVLTDVPPEEVAAMAARGEEACCPLCLDVPRAGHSCTRLPCGHTFHSSIPSPPAYALPRTATLSGRTLALTDFTQLLPQEYWGGWVCDVCHSSKACTLPPTPSCPPDPLP